MNITVRKGNSDDLITVHRLIMELAVFEKMPDEVETSVQQLQTDWSDGAFDFLVAEKGGNVLGFALYYVSYSTWKGRCLYLEDFLVTEESRRKGIGALLFEAVIREAKAMNAKRMDWQVLDWNQSAIDFYKKYNAEIEEGWLNGRFYEKHLAMF